MSALCTHITGSLNDSATYRTHSDQLFAEARVSALVAANPKGTIIICLACDPCEALFVCGVKNSFGHTTFFDNSPEAFDHRNKLAKYHSFSSIFCHEIPTGDPTND